MPERTRFHDLKHFYTSTLGASGRHDPKTVQALSRHGEFSATRDTYAHPPLAVEGVTVTTFSSVFAPEGVDSLGEQGRTASARRGERSVVRGERSNASSTDLDRASA